MPPNDLETGEAIDARARLVAWALSQVGERDPNEYYRVCAPQFADRGAEHSISWCGIFCLAGLRLNDLCDWEWSTRRTEPGFVYRLRVTAFPDTSDIAVFEKGANGATLWHHAFVRRLEGGVLYTVDGNTGYVAPKEGVSTRERKMSVERGNVTFYSIASLLRDL